MYIIFMHMYQYYGPTVFVLWTYRFCTMDLPFLYYAPTVFHATFRGTAAGAVEYVCTRTVLLCTSRDSLFYELHFEARSADDKRKTAHNHIHMTLLHRKMDSLFYELHFEIRR